MNQTASCVIIGAGIAGASTAYYLAAKGVANLVLLDKGSVASGATSYSAAYAFTHHSNPWKVRLSDAGQQLYRNWDDIIGGDCSWRTVGYTWFVSPEETDIMKEHVSAIQAMDTGTPMYTLGPEDIKVNWPYYNVEDIGGASYEPDAGHADGSDAANGMVRRFREMGGRLEQGAEVTKLLRDEERITGVELASGDRIDADNVVLATGGWSAILARTADVNLSTSPVMICAGIIARPPETLEMTTVMDQAAGIWFRPDVADNTLVSILTPEAMKRGPGLDPDNYLRDVGHDDRARSARRLAYRIPALEDAYFKRSYTAVDGWTEDGMPLLGPVPQLDNLYVITGFSGYGFMQGPAAGQSIAEMIVDGEATSFDVKALRSSRFEEGDPIAPSNDYTHGATPWVQRKFGDM